MGIPRFFSLSSLLIIYVFPVLASSGKVLLVSDIDDTIKVSHVLSTIGKFSRAADVTTPFQGMAELYHLIINENPSSTKVIYLSNAPENLAGLPVLKISHQTFLSLNHFPPGELSLRQDIFETNHKLKELQRLLKNEKPDVVILIGDNGERDAEIYHQIALEFSSAKIKIVTYIHQLYSVQNSIFKPDFLEEMGKPILSDQNGFVTPIEISLKLNEQGLLSGSGVDWMIQHIAPAIVSEERYKWDGLRPLTFPHFKNCQDFKWIYPRSTELQPLISKIESECN